MSSSDNQSPPWKRANRSHSPQRTQWGDSDQQRTYDSARRARISTGDRTTTSHDFTAGLRSSSDATRVPWYQHDREEEKHRAQSPQRITISDEPQDNPLVLAILKPKPLPQPEPEPISKTNFTPVINLLASQDFDEETVGLIISGSHSSKSSVVPQPPQQSNSRKQSSKPWRKY